jgi:hypothetical protein
MEYSTTFPKEPSGPVWDVKGDRYDKTEHGLWKSPGYSQLRTWEELLFEIGPLTDVAPLDLEVGRLYAVTKDDDSDKTYVGLVPYGEDDRLYVVLPADNYEEVVRVRDVKTCEPIAVVPQQYADLDGNVKDWLYGNQELQPKAAEELLADYEPGGLTMKQVDPTKPVPMSVTTMWDARGVRFDHDEDDPDMWWYDLLFRNVEDWPYLRKLGPYYTAPPQDWTWTENIQPETDYYARTERVHPPYREIVGVCRSSNDGESLAFEDGSIADRHNDIVRDSFPIVPTDRLSLPATVVLDLILKTDGLDDIKSDLLADIRETYKEYERK